MSNKQLKIKNWSDGIAESNQLGFQNIENADAFNIYGVIRSEFEMQDAFKTLSQDSANNDMVYRSPCTFSSNYIVPTIPLPDINVIGKNNNTGQSCIYFTGVGTLPSAIKNGTTYTLQTNTLYYVSYSVSGANALALYETLSDAINNNNQITFTNNTTTEIAYLETYSVIDTESYYYTDNQSRNYTSYFMVANTNFGANLFVYNISGLAKWICVGNLRTYNQLTIIKNIGNGWLFSKNYIGSGSVTLLAIYAPDLIDRGVLNIETIENRSDYETSSQQYDVCIYSRNANRLLFTSNSRRTINYIQIQQNFVPTTPETFTIVRGALKLLVNEQINCMEEIKENIYFGTNNDNIYWWNNLDVTFSGFIKTLEDNIIAMQNINESLWYSCGVRGNMYKTLGQTSEKILDLSDQLMGIPLSKCFISDIKNFQGKILIYVSQTTNILNNQASTQNRGQSGVYYIDNDSNKLKTIKRNSSIYNSSSRFTLDNGNTIFGGKIIINNISSQLTKNSLEFMYVAPEKIIKPIGQFYYNVNTLVSGITTSSSNRQSSGCLITSQLFEVGDILKPATFKNVIINLIENLSVSRGSILIYFRKDNKSDFSLVKTFTYLTNPTDLSFYSLINIQTTRFIQFRIEIQSSNQVGYSQLSPSVSSVNLEYTE